MPRYTKEELLKFGEIDPELDQFLKSNELPQVDYSDISAFKKMAEERGKDTIAALGAPPPDVKVSETTFPASDGTKLRAKIFKPATPPSEGSALIVLFHGGGFCIGAPEGEEQTARNLVQAFGAVCVSAQYRLAPEHKFPAAPEDAWSALSWAAKSASELGADASKGFIVGGTSAGGNIAAVLAHRARDEKLTPALTGQYLAIPAVCPKSQLPEKYLQYSHSFEQNRDVPVLPIAAIDMFMKAYEADPKDSKRYAIFNHPDGHANLPPAYFQIDGMDPLRDEGIIYADVLEEEEGIKTKVDVYPGLPHGHWGFFPFLKSSAKFRKDQVNGFGWLLGKEPAVEKVTTQVNPTTV